MSKSIPVRRMAPLPAGIGETPEAEAFNLLFRNPSARMLTVAMLKKNEAKETLRIAVNWLLALLGDMPPKVAREHMKAFERIAADSIGYDLDEE